MNNGHMPGSMDLLLDTMCNTFGGVVFIALSLFILSYVGHNNVLDLKEVDKLNQELKIQKQLSVSLKLQRNRLIKKTHSLKKLSLQHGKRDTNLPVVVVNLKHDLKKLQRDIEFCQFEKNDINRKINQIAKENKKLNDEICSKNIKVKDNLKRLRSKYQRTCLLIDELSEKLQSTPNRTLNFAHYETTRNIPYVLIVKDGKLYCLGTNYFKSNNNVSVQRLGNKLVLNLIKGISLSMINDTDWNFILPGYNKSSEFLWVMVHPNSFEDFIDFRRLLRQCSLQVHWYIDNCSVLYLSNNVKYSASY